MLLLSRLLRVMKDVTEDLAKTGEDLDAGEEEEGLLISTGRQASAPAAEAAPAVLATDPDLLSIPATPPGAAATPGLEEATLQQDQIDGVLKASAAPPAALGAPAAAPAAGPAGSRSEAPAAQATAAPSAPQEVKAAPAEASPAEQSDDPLSLFRTTSSSQSGVSEFTKHIEDVPIDELIAALREVRALLPTAGQEAGTAEEGKA